MDLQKSLAQLGDRIAKARDDLRIVEEQILFQMDVVEETKTRSVVAETPLADREHQIANDDYQRMQRERERVISEIADLKAEQDRLLDLMLSTKR